MGVYEKPSGCSSSDALGCWCGSRQEIEEVLNSRLVRVVTPNKLELNESASFGTGTKTAVYR